MAFQAFENKRRTQLGNLTRRRRLIEDLAAIEVTRLHITVQRDELEKIRAAHEDVTNSMEEQPECQGELADRLAENIDKFYEAYDELQEKLTQYELQLTPVTSPATSERREETPFNEVQDSATILRRHQLETNQSSNIEQHKSRFKMMMKEFDCAVNAVDQDQRGTLPLGQLQALLNNVTQIKQQMSASLEHLMIHLDDLQLEPFEEKASTVREEFLRITTLLHEKIEEKTSIRASQSATSVNSQVSSRIKLPPIDLPKFTGSPESWIPFRDLYIALIHNNLQLSGSQKCRYLKTSIIDKLSPIKFDAETDAGYDDSWKKVLAFYDDKRKIVVNHFGALLNAKKMSSESSDELQKLVNDFSSNIDALQRLLTKEELFDAFTAHLAAQRLDSHTRDLWESENTSEIPTWPAMQVFMEKRRKTLTAIAQSSDQKRSSHDVGKSRVHHASSNETYEVKCFLCNDAHRLTSCPKFLEWDVNRRHKFAKEKKLCYNCLGKSHNGKTCPSIHRCRVCKQSHHTLLHFNKPIQGLSASSSSEVEPFVPYNMTKTTVEGQSTSNTVVAMEAVNFGPSKRQTLLSTIEIQLEDSEGIRRTCRALLDSGSDSNFITTKCAKKLNLDLQDTCMSLTGISEKTSIIRHKTTASIVSHYGPFEMKLDFSVMPQITGNLPMQSIDLKKLCIPAKYELADPKFNQSASIDLLLSAEVFYESLLGEKFRLPEGPMMIHTKFGWIIGGEMKDVMARQSTTLLSCFGRTKVPNDLHEMEIKLDKFFETEDVDSSKPVWTAEEKYCEELFAKSTTKDKHGRPIVRMPFKESSVNLGSNLKNATRQFYAQEKRRLKDDVYNKLYIDYMNDFINTGHMTEVEPQPDAHYLPHHGVLKMSSTTTKLRPVFNASSITETGNALNNVLCVGPTIQPESIDIITRFREKKFVITGDVSKMYRQIWIHPSQRKFLTLLWRPTTNDQIKHYQLNVVTFGTSCAPFLATRVLKMIADENAEKFPEAAAILNNSFYVDDTMFGVDSIQDGIKIRDQLREMLANAGMTLGKMTANHPALLEGLPASCVEVSETSNMIKALGILYDVKSDQFSYKMKPSRNGPVTKTDVLSEIACIYDPIGWLGPVVLLFKIFMKKLWLIKLDWKDELPEELQDEWNQLRQNLPAINEVKIKRRCLIENHVKVELHGFCDASINGYGAVIYALSNDANGNVQTSILCSKSRVAPKNQKTLARLELCSATLLAKLITRYAAVLSVQISDVVLWSDSTIVLNWITMSPNKLQTFVGNRVAVIQELTHKFIWRHIRGDTNPADVISRGLMPQEISTCVIWWNGPDFFRFPKTQWPESIITVNDQDPEVASEIKKALTVTKDENFFTFIENKRDSVRKIQRIFACVLRFVSNTRKTVAEREFGPLTLEELKKSEVEIIKILQKTIYASDYKQLQKSRDNKDVVQQVSSKSPLISLSPFMDSKGIMRVRGRLEACPELTYDQKHQIILPTCNYSTGIVRDFHRWNLHPTKSTLLSIIFQRFWIIKAKNIVKKVQHECIKCFRTKPKTAQQLMGDLPEARVKLTTPFVNTAIDYTGFYTIKTGTTRNAPSTKSYVAVFKCMCTGAIHLDVASDLSSQSFIAVLDRFVSRRGLCAQLYSDNATCFEGANNKLKKIIREMEPEVKQYCSNRSIKWNFTTPRSPSAGGIYESAVKAMKHHLKRVMDHPFTFEQFSTILCKIEAILNSRPLTPLSEDPEDFRVLSPGHFLIGRPLAALPEANHLATPSNRLKHWEGLQQIQQIFWQMWHKDYLRNLQSRPVKFRQLYEFKIGDMVLLKDDNLPPMQWLMGRIIKLFPGKDKVVRNVKVQTQYGSKERNVRVLCPLPFQKNVESSSEAGECVS